jgi:hypothetical protein
MAQFYKNLNSPTNYANAASFWGKQPDYFEINFGNASTGPAANLTSTWNVSENGAYGIVIQTIEQTATIETLGTLSNSAISFVNGTTGNILARVATTGVNAASSLQTEIQALGNVATGNGSTIAPFSNVSFSNVTVTPFVF